MAKRSTRQKIKYHGSKLSEHIDRVQAELQVIDSLADGRSDWITNELPKVLEMSELFREVCLRFTDRL